MTEADLRDKLTELVNQAYQEDMSPAIVYGAVQTVAYGVEFLYNYELTMLATGGTK